MMFEVDSVECPDPTEDRRLENKMQDGSTWVPIGRRCLIISEEGYKWRWRRGVQERKAARGRGFSASHSATFIARSASWRADRQTLSPTTCHGDEIVNKSIRSVDISRSFLCLHREEVSEVDLGEQ